MKTRLPMIPILLVSCLAAAAPAAASPVITDADRANARALLEELIAIPTVKGEGKVPQLAELLAARFKAAGFSAEDIEVVPVKKGEETTAALVVRYRAAKPGGAGPVALLAHMDVVGAVAANWTSDPFKSVAKEGYLYGRGALDNKAQVALLTTGFIRLRKAGWAPTRDLILAFSGDEESGSATTQALVRHRWVSTAEFALNADSGTGDRARDGSNPVFFIQAAEKTSVSFRIEASNSGGHSSVPRADNALYDIAGAIKGIEQLRFPVTFNEINRSMATDLAAQRPGELGDAFRALLADPGNAAARSVAERYPEDAHILWTTCVPTMIAGGNARNALPQNVALTVHCRILPGTETAEVEAAIIRAVANPAVKVTVDEARASSPVSPLHPDIVAAVTRAVHANYPGAPVRPEMSSGGSDGRYFRQAGIPTYGVGSLAIVHPDDKRAHGIDERLPLASFNKELVFWDVLLRDIGGFQPAKRD